MTIEEYRIERDDSIAAQQAPSDLNSSKSFKILHMAASGENARWMVEQLRELRKLGNDVYAVIPAKGRVSEALEREGIQYGIFDLDLIWRGTDYFTLFSRVRALAEFIYREKFDVVHTHMFTSSIIGRIASWLCDCPVRVRMVPEVFYLEANTPAALEFGTCWMSSKIIPSCTFVKKMYLERKVPENKLALVYYGADSEVFDSSHYNKALSRQELLERYNLHSNSLLIAHVAYFVPPFEKSEWIPNYLWGKAIKGHEIIIDAMPLILQHLPMAKLLLTGDTYSGDAGQAYFKSLKTRVSQLNLENSVIFTGFIPEVSKFLSGVDIAVQPSLSENLGGTIEALLMQLPVVASETGGLIDAIKDGDTGLLVKVGDSTSLAKQIQFLGDSINRERLGQAGREYALDCLTLNIAVHKFTRIYQDLLYRRSRGHKTLKYRVWVILLRLPVALLVIAWVGFLCCRNEIRNRISWMVREELKKWFRTFYLALKRLLDILGSFVLLCLFPIVIVSSKISPCKKYSATILPSLTAIWAIFIGNKTFVGLSRLDNSHPDFKVGITGWSALKKGKNASCEEIRLLDDLYVASANPVLDLKILFKALLSILCKE